MPHELLVGCDIGTSGTKTVVTDAAGGVLAHATASYGLITPHNGWAEQWPDVWLDAAVDTIARACRGVDASRVAAVCISALYGGTGVMCDEAMQPIRPAIIWMDRRADREGREAGDAIGRDAIFDITGNGTDSYFGYVKLLWVKRHEPDKWARIRHILPVHSYVVARMTGALTIDHSSAGNLGGVYDYAARRWSKPMADRLGIDISTMPSAIGAPTDIAGRLNAEFAAKTGLPEGVPLCVGTVDCIASMLSAGIVGPGDNAAVLGTSLNWGFIHGERPSDVNLVSMPYCVEPTRLSYTYGGASTAGALPRWFMDNFAGGESPEGYRDIEAAVVEKRIPAGSGGLVVLPYFMGERTPIWDENACGEIVGLSLAHTREHVYRAMLEASAYALRHIMESAGAGDVRRIILVGGGAKSALWRRIFADVTGLPVLTTVQPVEAPLGDAFMAGLAAGRVGGFDEISAWVDFDPPTLPDAAGHAIYDGYFEVYKQLYPNTRDQMRALKRLAMDGVSER